MSSLTTSTEVGGQDGGHALKVVFSSTGGSDLPYVKANPAGGPAAGQTVTAYVQVPAGSSSSVTAKLYVQDGAGTWHTAADTRT